MNIFKTIIRILIISSPLWLNDFYLMKLPPEFQELRLILDIIFYIFFQSILIYMAYSARWFSFADINLSLSNIKKQTVEGLFILIVVFTIAIILNYIRVILNTHFNLNIAPPKHASLPAWHPVSIFLYVLYLSSTAGIFEEVIYRGIVISQIRKVTSNSLIIAATSALVFSLIHWSLGLSIMSLAFILGLFWAVLFLKTGRLLPLILAHFSFDFITFFDFHLFIYSILGISE